MGRFSPVLESRAEEVRAAWAWRPSAAWAALMVGTLVVCLAQLHGEVRFLYFQF